MTTWTCPCTNVNPDTSAKCLKCGKARAVEVPVTEEGMLAERLDHAFWDSWKPINDLGETEAHDCPMDFICADSLGRKCAIDFLARARELLSPSIAAEARRRAFEEAVIQVVRLVNRPHPRTTCDDVVAEQALWKWLCDRRDQASLPAPAEPQPATYPCANCGKLRTKAEGGEVFTTCEGPGFNCDGTPEDAAEPAAPVASGEAEAGTIALDAWLDSRDVMQSTRSEVRHCYRSDLARATKGLRERETQWVELANERLRERDAAIERAEKAERERDGWKKRSAEKDNLRAGLSIVLHDEFGACQPVDSHPEEDAIRILREQKVENEKLRGEVARADRLLVAECLARVRAERDRDQYREDLERTRADLAALRASQPAGLPGVGESFLANEAGAFTRRTVLCHSMYDTQFSDGNGCWYRLADEGKTWRRLPTGEKEKG